MAIIIGNETIKKRQDILRAMNDSRDAQQIQMLENELAVVDQELKIMTLKNVDDINKNIKKVVNMPEIKTIKDMKKDLNASYQEIREEYKRIYYNVLQKNIILKRKLRDDLKIVANIMKESTTPEDKNNKIKVIWNKYFKEGEAQTEEEIEQPMKQKEDTTDVEEKGEDNNFPLKQEEAAPLPPTEEPTTADVEVEPEAPTNAVEPAE